MKKKFYKALMFMLPLLVVVSIPLASAYEKGGGIISAYIELIDDRSPVVIDRVDLGTNLIEGVLDATDKYSYYLDNSEYESHVNEYEDASFVGIGISMIEDEKGAYIVNVFRNSPAQRAGLKSGDIIVSAAGKKLVGLQLQDIGALIKGPKGTSVVIGVLKQGTGEPVEITLERAEVDITTVDYTIYKDAAYVRITGFTSQTGVEFRDVLSKVDKSGKTKLIVDIRDNGGGAVNGCIGVADALIENADIVKLDFRFIGFIDFLYKAYEKERDYEIAILVNGNSASASEILAAAVQDNGEGFLVGEKTFGKSLVQITVPILDMKAYEKYSEMTGNTNMYIITRMLAMQGIQPSDDEWAGAMKMTVGEYLTPNGKSINNEGIVPDYEIEYNGPIHFDGNISGMLWIYEKYSLGMASEEIRKAKEILRDIGFYKGAINGQYDDAMVLAVNAFQEAEGLYPYGVLDFTTQQALNNRLKMMSASEDAQLELAYLKLMEGGDGE
ncbi:MAG TPA: S41 family peptidase [Clostridia bacterium]|nr:S41 family peptidase [Clostridia bacterium]HRX41254.1 S41 family peptidase [Clostridia bacterium]